MRSQILGAGRTLGAIILSGVAFFCGYGYLASYKWGFLNVFHHGLYGAAGVAALLGALWFGVSVGKSMVTWAAALRKRKPSFAFRVAVVLLAGVVGGIGGGIFGLVIGALYGGNYAPDFAFAGGRGYEAGASLGSLLGFVIGGFGSGVVAALALRRMKAS